MSTATEQEEGPLTPDQARAELATLRFGEDVLTDVLDQVARLAARTVPGAAEVSITVKEGERAFTAAHTGPVSLALDERQYQLGWGPCLDCLAGGEVARVGDTADRSRWPGYCEAAQAAGIGSSFAVPVPLQRELCASLNVYGGAAHAFDDGAVELAREFAAHAGIALGNAHLYESQARRAQQLQEAMSSRAVIEQAKGVLMARHHVDAEAAFDLLVRHSQQPNRKLRDVAASLVEGVSRPPSVG